MCENNGFAEFTSREEHTTIERVSDVVAPYGFERETVDGQRRPGGLRRVRPIPGRGARAGSGPFLLECLTYRRRGHYEGDPQKYRDPVAEQEWARARPDRAVDRASDRRRAGSTRTSGAAIEREAAAEIEAAVAFARDSPFPDPAITAGLVYAT